MRLPKLTNSLQFMGIQLVSVLSGQKKKKSPQ